MTCVLFQDGFESLVLKSQQLHPLAGALVVALISQDMHSLIKSIDPQKMMEIMARRPVEDIAAMMEDEMGFSQMGAPPSDTN